MILVLLGKIFLTLDRIKNRCVSAYHKRHMKSCGQGVYIGKGCLLTAKNIEIGDDTYIGVNCVLQSSFGSIKIGSHVMFGPGVNIHGGNHKFDEIGQYMKNASPKKQGDDGVIIIEDDCWIGANTIILSNVTVGHGSVIGAGAIVTKSLPPYSVYTGAPQQRVRERFSEKQIAEHEAKLKSKQAYCAEGMKRR